MRVIDDLIRQRDCVAADDVDISIKIKLKIINNLFEEIKDSEDRIYMEEIISKFADIIECQRETISELLTKVAAADGYGPMQHNWRTTPPRLTADDIPWDPECAPENVEKNEELPSYLPPKDGFQTDGQVKKAFTNYLTYHVVRKTKAGREKPFSIHTVYDYCSRIKVLWEIVFDEWQASNRDGWLHLNEQTVCPGCTFLNAYNNLGVLQKYIQMKDLELREIGAGQREPLPADEAKKNPLNNVRNLGNTTAALAKFEEFIMCIDHRKA